MGRKKKVEDLSENRNLRTVKLHFHRFGKFLRYLRDNDAVVTLQVEDENGIKRERKFSADPKDSHDSLIDLGVDALGSEPWLIYDYMSRRLGVDDSHADKDRVDEIGKTLNAITFYLASDGLVDEKKNTLKAKHPFGSRSLEINGKWNTYLDDIKDKFPQAFSIIFNFYLKNGIRNEDFKNEPFAEHIVTRHLENVMTTKHLH